MQVSQLIYVPLTSINDNICVVALQLIFIICFAMKIQQHYQNSTIPHLQRDVTRSEGHLWMLGF